MHCLSPWQNQLEKGQGESGERMDFSDQFLLKAANDIH